MVRWPDAMPSRGTDRRIVQVLERQRVPLPQDLDTARIRERLVSAAAAAGMPDALENRRRALFAKGAVGVVDIGEVAVEILPKTQDGCTADEGRSFLMHLLRFVGRDRGPFATAAANIGNGEVGLAEVLYAWAIGMAARHIGTGLPRRYVPHTESSTAVRGRIDMKRVALARPGRDFELIIRHAPLSINSDVGRAVKWLIREIETRTRRAGTRRVAQSILGELHDLADIEADEALFDRIILRPLEGHWEPLLSFARSLARQRNMNPAAAGTRPAVAVLFTMHDLFERAIRRVLEDDGQVAGLSQTRIPKHLLFSKEGSNLVKLIPDYVFTIENNGTDWLAVGDAKWKDIWNIYGNPEPSREDAYQLAAYMAAGKADAGFLFAPLVRDNGQAPLQVFCHTMAGTMARVDIIGIHVPTLLRLDDTGELLRRSLCAACVTTMREAARVGAPT